MLTIASCGFLFLVSLDCLYTLITFCLQCLIFNTYRIYTYNMRRRGAARLTHDRWIPFSREFEPHQRPRCFLEQETLL